MPIRVQNDTENTDTIEKRKSVTSEVVLRPNTVVGDFYSSGSQTFEA